MRVQVLECQYELGYDEAGSGLSELLPYGDKLCQVAVAAVVQGHVEVHWCLEGVEKLNDKGTVHLLQYLSLTDSVF